MDKEFSDFISNVLDKTDIVSLISKYVKVERKGNTYWACCPFHHESQPSFSVSAEKQFFHCFGCKESGNALSFLMKMENIEFIDALKMLAEQAGMEMPKPKNRTYTRERIDKKKLERLYGLMRTAARHYYENLSSPRAGVFNNYIKMREIPETVARKFGLGASLDFDEMINYLSAKGYSRQEMYDAGIAEEKNGRYYDVFGKRLMFPVIDNMNNVVAFGGRTLEKDVHFAKYRNSSETWFFEKAQVIYGANLLKKRQRSGLPIDYIIVAEGYMDVIALHKAGFETAVATMGTAFTSKQARHLKLYSEKIYISYDGDTAGQKAIMRGLDILRETGLTVKVVRLPEGMDPDEVIKRDGADGYRRLLNEAVPLTEHKINVLKTQYDMSDPDQKAKFAIEAANVVKAIDNAVEQGVYLKKISDITGFPIDALRRQADLSVMAARMKPQPSRPDPESASRKEYDASVKFFLASIVQAKDYVDYDKTVTKAMPDEFAAQLYEWCREHKNFVPADLFNIYGYDNPVLNELYDYKELPGDGRQKFIDIENRLYSNVLDSEREELLALYRSTNDKNYLYRAGEIGLELAKYNQNRS